MTDANMYEEYLMIHKAWNDAESYGDIYDMIVDWIEEYMDSLKTNEARKEANELWDRFESSDDTKEIVEDFIHGDRYAEIRREMIIV
jgi:hypothetical protein